MSRRPWRSLLGLALMGLLGCAPLTPGATWEATPTPPPDLAPAATPTPTASAAVGGNVVPVIAF